MCIPVLFASYRIRRQACRSLGIKPVVLICPPLLFLNLRSMGTFCFFDYIPLG